MTYKLNALVALFLFCICFFLNAEEKVLQNGLNDYDGCTDTYLTEEGEPGPGPHGDGDMLHFREGW